MKETTISHVALVVLVILGVFMGGISNAYLTVSGNTIVGDDSKPIKLKGVALDNGMFSKWDDVKKQSVMIKDSSEVEWSLKEADVDNIKKMGANVVRYCINAERFSPDNPSRVANFQAFAKHLNWFKKRHIYVIVNLHIPPGHTNYIRRNENSIFESQENWKNFTDFWTEFINRHKKENWIAGWELFSEPQIPQNMKDQEWHKKVNSLIKTLRKIDTKHIFFICNAEARVVSRDSKGGHIEDWKFIPLHKYEDPNLVYVFHWYHPPAFTQQGMDLQGSMDRLPTGIKYPFKTIENQKWIGNSEAQFSQKAERGWFFFKSGSIVPPTNATFGLPFMSVNQGNEKVYFDCMKIYEIAPDGNKKEIILPNPSFKPDLPTFMRSRKLSLYDFKKTLHWSTFFPNKYDPLRDRSKDPGYEYNSEKGFDGNYSVSIENRFLNYSQWTTDPSQFHIKLKKGYKYEVEGWASDWKRAQLGISWHQGALVVHDKNEMARLIFQRYVAFSKQYNVPLIATEFGSIGFAGIEDRARWTQDVLNIFRKHRISYTYWTYNSHWGWGNDFTLYLKDPFDPNKPFHQYDQLIKILSKDLSRN